MLTFKNNNLLIIFCYLNFQVVRPSFLLAGFSLSRKHGLAKFRYYDLGIHFLINLHRHWRLNGCAWTLMIIKYSRSTNLPPTRLQCLNLLVFSHPCLYAGDFNFRHVDWITMTTVRTVSDWLAGRVLIVLPSYTM